MVLLNTLLAFLLPLAAAQFIPPEAILQAGYPAGFRAFVPDFPGCQQFAFHGKINSPFTEENELGSIFQEILMPQNGFWIVQDWKLILTPGSIIHYRTNIVKDGTAYPKYNQTWKVPGPKDSVDLLSPITVKPPKPTPQKVKETEPTPTEDVTTPGIETAPTSSDETSPSNPPELSTSSSAPPTTTTTPTTAQTTKSTPTTAQTTPSTTKPTPTTLSPTTSKATPPPTTKPISENQETPNPKTSPTENPHLAEEVEELTTPFLPVSGELPEEPPLYPFPGPFPRPIKPMMPSNGPGFEICSNPWNFEEKIGETRTQKLERQVAKLQCQLALFQRGYNHLSNTVESELTDLKKLIYGMVSRMASLESVLRAAAFV